MFRQAVIIGVGQIGASIGMNLVAKKLAKEVIGVGRNPDNLLVALRQKAIHRAVREGASGRIPLLSNLSEKDLVILATPVRTIRVLLKRMPHGPLIIDVGSTKSAIVSEASKRRLRFVGCHPIAGTEVPGAVGAEKDLFRGKVCLVTPSARTSREDLRAVQRLWGRLGSSVESLSPEMHDRLLASFSHLPHVLAYGLMAQTPLTAVPRKLPRKFFAGLGSFKSATRVAASEPTMWRDILLENRDFILPVLDRHAKELKTLRTFLSRRDAAGLLRYLEKSQKKRLEIL